MRFYVREKLKRGFSTAMSTALAVLTALPPSQLRAQSIDLSAERYEVTIQPSGNQRLLLRDEQGNFLGYSGNELNLDLTVDGTVIRNSIRNGVPDTQYIARHAISTVKQYVDENGTSYLRLKTPEQTVTADGKTIPAGTVIMVERRYFINDEVVAAGATGSDNSVAQEFSDAAIEESRRRPKTEELTVPVPSAPPRTEIEDDGHDHDEEADDDPIAGYDGSRTFARGNPFPTQIFSAPLCGCPTGGCWVTSGFGGRRVRNGSRNHKGIDIGAAGNRAGAKVIAAAPGIVKAVQTNIRGGYGIMVVIDHGNGVETRYAHLKNFDRNLIKIGARIDRGQYIGLMGNTGRGRAGRPYKQHLHFEIRQNGTALSTIPRMAKMAASKISEASKAALSRSCSNQPNFLAVDMAMNRALKGAYSRSNLMTGARHIRNTGSARSGR